MVYVILFLAILLLIAAYVLVRTFLLVRSTKQNTTEFKSNLPDLELDPQKSAEHLSEVVKIETISHENPAEDVNENFTALHDHLAKMYPRTHAVLTREVLDGFSLLYTWQGKNQTLQPVVFMAHQDVVPADGNTLNKWTHPPFSGKITDGYIWGRGTLDIKCQLIATLEAVEHLIINNFQPERTILLAFGHNEEILGTGAVAIVNHLKEKGIRVQAVVDEGGSIYDGIIPGVKGYAANVGVAEKGYLSLKFTVNANGGHSSTPTSETAIGVLCRAIDRLQSNPFPYNLNAALPMLRAVSPNTSTVMQIAIANPWLFGGIIRRKLAADPKTAAAIHTTLAPTIIHSGVKDNVLPGLAEAVVNFRLLPGETIAEVCERIRNLIDDERVTFEPLRGNAWEASPLSPTDCPAFKHLVSLNNEFFPGSTTSPYIMLGGSDARHYYTLSDQVYRFTPYIMTQTSIEGIHGIDEKLSVDMLATMVKYFYKLMQRWASRDM